MRRDMDLIQALILRLEELPIETGDARTIEAGSTELVGMVGSKETIDYHLNLLRDAGFLNCPTSDQPNFGISYKGLTWAGHDLADSVRNKSGLQKCVSERAADQTASHDESHRGCGNRADRQDSPGSGELTRSHVPNEIA